MKNQSYNRDDNVMMCVAKIEKKCPKCDFNKVAW